MEFLIRLHLSMFYILVTAGTICTIWGLGLLIARYRAMKQVALEVGASGAQQDVAGGTQPATDTSSGEGSSPKAKAARVSDQPTVAAAQVSATPPASHEIPPRRQSLISPLYRSALKVTGYLALIQAILGGVLWLTGARPADQLHIVYGIVVLLAVPVAFVYMTGKPERMRRDLTFLIIAALVVAAAAVRAWMTG